MAKYYLLKMYRLRPGDVEVSDRAIFDEEGRPAIELARDCLLDFFENSQLPDRKKPHHGMLLADTGEVVAQFRATPHGVQDVTPHCPDWIEAEAKEGP